MLVSLMYHHIESDQYSNSIKLINAHFEFISNKYKTIFPNEYKKSFLRIELCLVFDDAYFDFYFYVFPLLKKYDIKVILAVPTKFILDHSTLPDVDRLEQKHNDIMIGTNYKKFESFCTWTEIKEMVDSGHVIIASHGNKHQNLLMVDKDSCINELLNSKEKIKEKTGIDTDIFVYPFGKYNKDIYNVTKEYYKYQFSIGKLINLDIKKSIIYRVYADDMINAKKVLSPINIMKYVLLYIFLTTFPYVFVTTFPRVRK